MGGPGDPAQTNIIAAHGAHGPDVRETAGEGTANQFDQKRKKYYLEPLGPHGALWAHGAHGPHGPIGPKPAAGGQQADGGRNLVHQTDAINRNQPYKTYTLISHLITAI